MNPGKLVADRFMIREQLGEGGMGLVCLAYDTRLNQNVALKFLSPRVRLNDEALAIMRREALKSLQLTHPNILRVYDFHEGDDTPPFIAMEHVDGTAANDLKAKLDDSLMPWAQVAPIARQICDALIYAHSLKVVHRDLKPANILIDTNGHTKLGDFGISASMMDTISQVTQDITGTGTPAYMSPEQMGGAPPNAQDDIYAFGATIYDLLTGKPPFYSGDIGFQVWHKPATRIPKRLQELGVTNEIPAYVTDAVMWCLAKDPKDRPQSIADVSTALRLEEIKVTTPVRHVAVNEVPAEDAPSDLTAIPSAKLAERQRHNRSIIFSTLLILSAAIIFIFRPPDHKTQVVVRSPRSTPPPTAIQPGILVNLLDPAHLDLASTIRVVRDNSIAVNSGAGRMRRLKSLNLFTWPERGKEWRLTNGILEVDIESIPEKKSREYTIWFPTSHATNYEVGYTYDWPENDLPEKQATTFFGRASTNLINDLAGMWSALDGVATADPDWRPMWLQGKLPGVFGPGIPRFGYGGRQTDNEPFVEDYLSTRGDLQTAELVERLRQSELVGQGGSWILIQAFGSKYRIIHNDRSVYHGDLAAPRFDSPGSEMSCAVARFFAQRPGSIGITTHYQDSEEPARFRYGDILFRSLDGLPIPEWAAEEPAPHDKRSSPPLSPNAVQMGFKAPLQSTKIEASEFTVVRDNINLQSRKTNNIRLAEIRPWNPARSDWQIRGGILQTLLHHAERGTDKETGIILDTTDSTDIEFGFAYRINRRDNEHGITLVWPRAWFDPATPSIISKAPTGIGFFADEKRPPILNGNRDTESPDTYYVPSKRSDFSPDRFNGDEYAGFRILMEQLQQTRLARAGGEWVAIRLIGGRYEMVRNNELIWEGDMLGLPASQPESRRDIADRIAHSSGKIVITTAAYDYNAPVHVEFEGLYYRQLE